MEYLVTFFEGFASFISPCMLPLLPVYISYFSANDDNLNKNDVSLKFSVLIRAVFFVLGFTIVFSTLGALAGSLGSLLTQYRGFVDVFCGAVVIFFSLCYFGIIPLSFLKGMNTARKATSIFSAFLLGCVYSLSLTPCVGPLLGSALSLAASSADMRKGVLLLVVYSLGVGLPFILSALLLERLKSVFSWVKRHYKAVNIICAAILFVIGSWMLFKGARVLGMQNSNTQSLEEVHDEKEIELNANNFHLQVLASNKPVLVDFWASWCPPCKMLSPVVSKLAQDYDGVIKVGKVDCDREIKLSQDYGIVYLPTLILFESSKVVKSMSGYRDYDEIVKFFELEKYR